MRRRSTNRLNQQQKKRRVNRKNTKKTTSCKGKRKNEILSVANSKVPVQEGRKREKYRRPPPVQSDSHQAGREENPSSRRLRKITFVEKNHHQGTLHRKKRGNLLRQASYLQSRRRAFISWLLFIGEGRREKL